MVILRQLILSASSGARDDYYHPPRAQTGSLHQRHQTKWNLFLTCCLFQPDAIVDLENCIYILGQIIAHEGEAEVLSKIHVLF